MKRLPGVDTERVERYGSRYLSLIRSIGEQFTALGLPQSKKSSVCHPKVDNTINLISDDEGVFDEDEQFVQEDHDPDEDLDDGNAGFVHNPDGEAFQRRRGLILSSLNLYL